MTKERKGKHYLLLTMYTENGVPSWYCGKSESGPWVLLSCRRLYLHLDLTISPSVVRLPFDFSHPHSSYSVLRFLLVLSLSSREHPSLQPLEYSIPSFNICTCVATSSPNTSSLVTGSFSTQHETTHLQSWLTLSSLLLLFLTLVSGRTSNIILKPRTSSHSLNAQPQAKSSRCTSALLLPSPSWRALLMLLPRLKGNHTSSPRCPSTV